MFQGIGPWEIVVILVVLALIFGASRIPEIGSNLGKGIKNFKKSFTEIDPTEDEKKKLDDNQA